MADESYSSFDEIVNSESFKNWMKSKAQLYKDLNEATSYYQKLLALKTFYLSHEKSYIENPYRWFSSYPLDWQSLMTPIEFQAWAAIRSKGRIVMYPQYPALNYILDFANPGLKIALELDGRDYHDKGRDLKRDSELRKVGWTVYRITGKEMTRSNFKELDDIEEAYQHKEDEDEFVSSLKYWLMNTGDGVIQAIREVHFLDSQTLTINENLSQWYHSYCQNTLKEHQLI
jgi:very-short-patch-repair endonuclease